MLLGGCGNASMLTVLRKVFPGVGIADGLAWSVLTVGRLDVEYVLTGFGVGRDDGVTEREAAGVGNSDAEDVLFGVSGRGLFDTLVFGIGGRGPVGGREGSCIAEVVLAAGDDMLCQALLAGVALTCSYRELYSSARHDD